MILDTLGLSHQYGFTELESSIGDYLREILHIRNVCGIFDSGRLYHLQFLTKVCTSFMDSHALDIIHHESFNQLSPVSLKRNKLSIKIKKILKIILFIFRML